MVILCKCVADHCLFCHLFLSFCDADDENRISLTTVPECEHSQTDHDYINASYIDVRFGGSCFITCDMTVHVCHLPCAGLHRQEVHCYTR